jgi:hypothetical protein
MAVRTEEVFTQKLVPAMAARSYDTRSAKSIAQEAKHKLNNNNNNHVNMNMTVNV